MPVAPFVNWQEQTGLVMLNRVWAFIMEMDARVQRAVLVSIALFVIVGLILVFGRTYLDVGDGAAIGAWLKGLSQSPIIIPAIIGTFITLAFLGVPQFILIAGAVVAVGPMWGGVYSWIATLISATVGYGLGVKFGAQALAGIPSRRLQRFIHVVADNGFLMSLVVRLVPSAPFIVVNMAAGVARIGLLPFLSGTALGILPKITLVAIAGSSLGQIVDGKGQVAVLAMGIAIAIWLGIMIWARTIMGDDEDDTQDDLSK